MITATHKGKYYDVEYSIVNVSELEGELRIDAEYYDPVYLRNEERIKKKKWCPIGVLLSKVQYGLSLAMNGERLGYKILKMDDIIGILADDSNCRYVDINSKTFQRFKLEKGDVLFNRVNSEEFVGRTGIYLLDGEHTFASYLIRLRAKNYSLNFYITIYLNTQYGQISLKRVMRRAVNQANINAEELKSLIIPIPSDTFQKFIEKLVLKAYEERKKAEELYKQAEDILLEELGLKNWKPKTQKIKISGGEFEEKESISIRMLSEIVKADRMDAEYWEPKYEEIEELIKSYKNGYSTVGKEFIHKTNKLKVYKDEYYNYVEISSINTSTGDYMASYLQGKELPANAKLRLEKDDLIISKVRTYRKGIALINKVDPNLIGSSAFVVLREKKDKQINIETLFVFLRTDIFSLWSYKFYTGTSYPTLTDEDILNLPIPLISPEIQQKISQLIQQSFKARENSKKLLEIATKTVEIAIEKNEKEALEYMKQETNL